MKTEFRFVGDYPGTLANGRPVAPGEFVELSDAEAKDNQDLVEEGKLLKIQGKAAGRHKVAPIEEGETE